MPKTLAEIRDEVLELPERDRAALAEQLLESLMPGEDVDAEEEWLEEAERRYKDYREGKTSARSVHEAMSEARKKLR
jgi:putative addiction module component (TIGR02574 family)